MVFERYTGFPQTSLFEEISDFMHRREPLLYAIAPARPATTTAVSNSQQEPWLTFKMDVLENPMKYVIKAELPGVPKDKINIHLEHNMLTIEGAREEVVERDEEKDKVKFHVKERSWGSFKRSMRLPEDVDESIVDASYDNGVLSIDIGRKMKKLEGDKKRKITIA
jgi:HSP20 family protein